MPFAKLIRKRLANDQARLASGEGLSDGKRAALERRVAKFSRFGETRPPNAGVVGPMARSPMAGGPMVRSPMADGPMIRSPMAGSPMAGGPMGGGPAMVDTANFKKGGKVKKMAKGGSTASKRADGCAVKGKTKGRFV